MKNKIIKLFEKPKLIIPAFFIFALIAGFFAYKFVGIHPQVQDIKNTSEDSLKSGEEISLAFPKGGRVNKVYVKTGDPVTKGQILAELDSVDALGALNIAKANYQKIVNGATGPDIDVAKSAVETAKVNLDVVKKQQEIAVKNAYENFLNSSFEAIPDDGTSDYIAPIVSGSYKGDKEGVIKLKLYPSVSGTSFTASGLTSGSGACNSINSQPIGDSGLFIKFPDNTTKQVTEWNINIPNKKASNYLSNYNAYQSALEAQTRFVSLAQASLNQAESTLNLKISNARPEDVAIALGSIQTAEGVYNNNFIYSPADGVVSVINIEKGEISIANQKAIGIVIK